VLNIKALRYVKIENARNAFDWFLTGYTFSNELFDIKEIFRVQLVSKTIRLITIDDLKCNISLKFQNNDLISITLEKLLSYYKIKSEIDKILKNQKEEKRIYEFKPRKPKIRPLIDDTLELGLEEMNQRVMKKYITHSEFKEKAKKMAIASIYRLPNAEILFSHTNSRSRGLIFDPKYETAYSIFKRNNKLYCICKELNDPNKEMICCENPKCRIQWFYLTCLKIKKAPFDFRYCKESLEKKKIYENN
jgi:hypothetical protein